LRPHTPKHKTLVSPSVSADPSDVKLSTDSVESPVRLNVSIEVVPRNFKPSNHCAQLPVVILPSVHPYKKQALELNNLKWT